MMTHRYSSETPEQTFIRLLGPMLPSNNRRVFLFGSRARGDADRFSDFDIGIDGPESLPVHIKRNMRWVLNETPYRVDLVDFSKVDDYFRAEALSAVTMLI